MKIFILSPHIDDAAYGLTLSISKFIAAGFDVTIINCFTITQWTIRFVSKEREVITKMRKAEDLRYRKILGDKLNIIDLDITDAPLRKGYIFQYKPLEPDEWEVVDKIKDYIKQHVDGLLFCPLAIGDHIDHIICREAVIHLYNRLQVIFFEDLPYTQRITEDQVMAHIKMLEEQLQVKLRNCLTGINDSEIDKEPAIKAYETQLSEEICTEIINYMNKIGGERLWGEEKILKLLAPRIN